MLKLKPDITKVKSLTDIKVFEGVFRLLYAPLCGYVNKIILNKEIAEEIVQEVFYVVWKNRTTLEIKTSIKSYLYRSAHNKALHYIEHEKVKGKYIDYISNNEQFSETPEQAMQTSEMYAIYQDTLKKLPENCRNIFNMSRNQGLKYKEIADKLSISVKTVEANMGRALKAFRQSFANY